MSQVLSWQATTKSGAAVVRGDGHREFEYRDMDVVTDVGPIRIKVDPTKGENLRAFTRRFQHVDIEGADAGTDAIAIMEVTTKSGDTVRLFMRRGEFLLTTEDG